MRTDDYAETFRNNTMNTTDDTPTCILLAQAQFEERQRRKAAAALEAAWPVNTDTELHALLPHLGHVYVVGRCGDLVFDDFDETTPLGEIQALATFIAHDPTRHEVP